MDRGHTYASNDGDRVDVYAPPELTPPDGFEMKRDGTRVRMFRVSPAAFDCGKTAGVTGQCTSHECHRAVLGECQCGRHEFGVTIRAAS